MKDEFLNLIEQVFGKDGAIVKLGGRYSDQQLQYAQHVGQSLIENNKVAFLEAETGIGKSLGYFVPTLLYLYLQKRNGNNIKPIAISTFTRQLQKQIFLKDAPFAKQALNQIGLDTSEITIAYRMGRTSFFSKSRTQLACERILFENPERKNELNNFLRHAHISCDSGTGLISDWLNDYGSFPEGIKTTDICLLARQQVDNDAYLLHLQQAKNADCLITNHATLINFKKVGIEANSFSAIFFDEAHKIEGICQDHFNYHSSFKELIRSLISTYKILPSVKEIDSAIDLLSELQNSISSRHKRTKDNYITFANSPEDITHYFQIIDKSSKLLKKASNKIDKYLEQSELEAETANALTNFDYAARVLEFWKPKQPYPHIISAIHFSPVIRKMSLATINIFGSRLMAWMCNELSDKAIYTSATISDNKSTLSFKVIANTLGYKDEEIGQQCSLSPTRYGEMNFVLSQKKINSPIQTFDDEQTEFDPDWLNNVLGMIEAAYDEGGAVLCLTTSHHESKVISDHLSHLSSLISVHKRNTALNEYLTDFISGKVKILITSAGWEGLDVRQADGSQLIKHVVISRIPFSPPDDLLEYFYNEYVKFKMKDGKYQAQGISWLNQVNNVVPKLKQGLGRGVRGPNDKVKIWIADPRMPHSNSERANSTLMYAIPKRFLINYSKASIFGEQKTEVIMI
ncbi:helicase C-terminal domain-containing protein [Comamonas sp.]|uniref:helicase C-terminal domain-containing protein n=1 Tax=Comamonas sp. TaxID=34028 RepID=UPI0012CC4DAE|nr:helicase C-terminal domain-containing protein [Comamonas sp.]MPS92858.1 DEAD/DEAH box helicase [Comamonas sp.]